MAPKRYLTEWQACHQAGGFCLAQEDRIPRTVGEAVIRAAAILEQAEYVEDALAELVKRASDPDVEANAIGARIMLDEALQAAQAILPVPTDG